MVTFADLIQFCILIVAIVGLVYKIAHIAAMRFASCCYDQRSANTFERARCFCLVAITKNNRQTPTLRLFFPTYRANRLSVLPFVLL